MNVNIKLGFIDGHSLRRMIELLRKIECPMKVVNCGACLYYDSCLKIRYITAVLEEKSIHEK